jgi:DNA-damage-inducible protein D
MSTNTNTQQNPDNLVSRVRQIYQRRGYSRRWVDKRLGGVSTRHDLVAQWHGRGARDSEQFRQLTNNLIHHAFGLNVETYRRYKGLQGTRENLRDHMSDLELALVNLAETTAIGLHQARNSNSFEQLEADTGDAGDIVAGTRLQIEQASSRAVVQPGHHGVVRVSRRRLPKNELAKPATDMHNPRLSLSERSVA